ncbi:MAG TPA: DNA recombination protein RmuC [Gaiellaceae bacterium]|jgi:DNA recombination protein RmuC|nr:DNA recombination protein RmuC [Gaiellaceae bacterium]
MIVGLLIVLVLLALGAAVVWLPRMIAAQLASLRVETARQLGERNAEVDRRLADVTETLDRRLASSGQTATQIHEKLGQVTTVMAEVNERAKDLGRLEQVLRPPKARGGFGELLLENLLRDRLPPEAYAMQHTFATGDRVDAVIRVDRLVPVDSKFPLDNFELMIGAEDEAQRHLHEKAFARDVKKHIDDISAKYILPDEGTYDFALMYLPAEAIYYELVSGKTGQLLTYAHERRVFPVSATTFTAYLQVIVMGLKGLQIEETAHEVMAYCAALQKDFGKFREDFELVGTHLSRAQSKYAEADKRLDRFETRLERAADLEVDAAPAEPPALPRALDAA